MYIIKNNEIEMFWDSDRIFDLVTLDSGYYGRNTIDKTTEGDEMPRVIMENDDKEFFVETLRKTMVKLYSKFIDIAQSSTGAFYVHKPDIRLGIFVSGFLLQSYNQPINQQRLDLTSTLCQEFISLSISLYWAEINKLDAFASMLKKELDINEEKLNNSIFHLKQKNYPQSYC